MAVSDKLPDKEKVLEVLNSSETVIDAAAKLQVSRQALTRFMSVHSIKRFCEYREVKIIDIKATTSAKDDPTSQARSRR